VADGQGTDKIKKDIDHLNKYHVDLNNFLKKLDPAEQDRILLFNDFDQEVPGFVRQQR